METLSHLDPDLPLIELHRHLDGNVRLETILDLGIKHNLPLPAWDIASLRPHIQVTVPQPGVMAFIARFRWLTAVMVDGDACRRIAYENVEDAHREGIAYIELRFSPWFMSQTHQLDPFLVTEAVVDGIHAGQRDFGVRVNLIGILSRTYGPEIATRELDALLIRKDDIVALDLAGDEVNFPAGLFRQHFRLARQAGWQATVHAGEIAGAASIWESINGLGASRIGHALRAVEDPGLLEYMARHRIGIESCLTSNVQTSCVPSFPQHPIQHFLECNIPVSINTDDPGVSNIDLHHEYETAAVLAGLSKEQIRQVRVNALETAFLSETEKQELLRKHARETGTLID